MTQTDDIRESVRAGYAEAARRPTGGCCGGAPEAERAIELGYDEEDLETIPEDAQMGLGCGNPSAIAELSEGDTVLDLGSGGGMDAFLAADAVGETGHVIGVDMTPEMLGRARDAASRRGVSHFVEFRRGYIEDLPVTDASVDVVLSNCVINLSTDKERVFREAHRVLRSGGRLAVSDICLTAELPEEIRDLEEGYIACISGAMLIDDYERAIEDAGFVDVSVERTDASALCDGACGDPVLQEALDEIGPEQVEEIGDHLWSVHVSGRKK